MGGGGGCRGRRRKSGKNSFSDMWERFLFPAGANEKKKKEKRGGRWGGGFELLLQGGGSEGCRKASKIDSLKRTMVFMGGGGTETNRPMGVSPGATAGNVVSDAPHQTPYDQGRICVRGNGVRRV